jgi:hypothetical protein
MLNRIACMVAIATSPAQMACAQNATVRYYAREVLMQNRTSSQDESQTKKYGNCGGYGVNFRVTGSSTGPYSSSVVGNVADKGAVLSLARTSAAAPLCEDTAPPVGYPQVMACEIASNGDVSAYYGAAGAPELATVKNAKSNGYVGGICEPA